jgi:tetratricopeptide (TPR) repeat protein
VPHVGPNPVKSIVFVGNCQADAVRVAYQRFVSPRTGDRVRYVKNYSEWPGEDRAAIANADVVVQLVMDSESASGLEHAETRAKKYHIPFVTAGWLWPNHGTPHPRRRDVRFNIAPMVDCTDAYLNRMVVEGVAPEEAAQRYLELQPSAFRGLDRRYELMMEKQRERDRASGFQTAEFIERDFRDRRTFLTPFHPALELARYIALSLFEEMGVAGEDIDRVRRFMHDSFYPRLEVPIHPAVAQHFKLKYGSENQRYHWFSVGPITFHEYAIRYMLWDTNDRLEQGFLDLREGRLDAARDNLIAGLAISPESANGFVALVRTYLAQGNVETAVETGAMAILRIPDDSVLRNVYGAALARLGRHAEAIPQFQAAARLNPGSVQPCVDMSFSFWQLGKLQDAEDAAAAGLEIEPWHQHLTKRIAAIQRDRQAAEPSQVASAAHG